MPSRLSPGDKVTIKIPRALYERLKLIVQGSGFDSVTDFVVYVLRDLVAAQGEAEKEDLLTADELRAIRRRLRNLGYL
ncbi:MAG: CopG family transcriptional regulator [bacterium]